MVEGAFNLFLIILELKSYFPENIILMNFRLDVVKMIKFHKRYGKIYKSIIEKESTRPSGDHLKMILVSQHERTE